MTKRLHMPAIGKRVYKTCLSALIVALFYHYVLGGRNPCFACIGAVYGMGSSFKEGFSRHISALRFIRSRQVSMDTIIRDPDLS